jgi:hypothetical protein
MTVTVTEKSLNARSASIAKASTKIASAIHSHACDIAAFIKSTGNVTPATTFVNLLSTSVRKNALRQWFISYGGCSWNAEKKAFGKKKDFIWDLVAAHANPFYDLIPEPDFKPVNGYNLIKAAIAQMEKALADTAHADKHKVDVDMLAELKEIVKKTKEPVQQTNKIDVKSPEIVNA